MTASTRTKMTAAEVRQLAQKQLERASARLDVRAPLGSGSSVGAGLASTIRLKVTEVKPYERNPRRATHEGILELKDSIRANGIEQIITVTKRPNEGRYVVAKGGNTRLLAAQSLYDETKDVAYLYRDFLVIDYPGEAALLAAHLRENDQRADLCFWDKSRGYLELKAVFESEAGRALSLREFSKMLADEGTQIGHVLLATFKFAHERLSTLGPAAPLLSGRDVASRIQPRVGALMRLAAKFGHGDVWVQQRLIEPELDLARAAFERTGALDVERCVEGFHERCADELMVNRSALTTMLGILEKAPDVTSVQLRATVTPPKQPSLLTPAAANEPAPAADLPAPRARVVAGDAGRKGGESSDEPTTTAASVVAGKTQSDDSSREPLEGAPSAPAALAVERGCASYPAGVRTRQYAGGPDGPALGGSSQASDSAVERCADESLWAALTLFARICGLEPCLREALMLPYGFRVEPPDLSADETALNGQSAEDLSARRRYQGWWWLANLSLQRTPAGLAVLRESSLSNLLEPKGSWARASHTWADKPLSGDRFNSLLRAVLDADDEWGGAFLDLLSAARAFRERNRSRFDVEFWRRQGVEEQVIKHQLQELEG
ncbi:chromosome partitioning protein ParB [Trinickia symbiotica]|uniref:Chromosome partitioning protein ParB n=1 Tax=Trinickia symbiotica TaxID=863227 RepID=A0A2T3XKJ0_9BURK|nr:ParB N-terminal domain-containing protein [Trinickia symbiotica]PTB17002.1 chromosome partitioning protein ParB [Trinickia symbiotica]